MPPDPAWSANLYCSEIDTAVDSCLRPIFEQIPAISTRLWWLRYPLGGAHLKVRFHSRDTDLAESVRSRFTHLCDDFLAEFPATATPGRRIEAPVIDREDEAAANGGQPSTVPRLVFTDYRRSSVSLGPEPLLGDDAVVTSLIEALDAGCRRLTASWQKPMTAGRRRRQLLEILIAGFGGLMTDSRSASLYLAYHRDWLIRALLVGTSPDGPDETEWLSQLDRHLTNSGLADILNESALDWREPADPRSWPGSLARLRDLIEFRYRDERFDPFAPAAFFTPVFKALHGIANALGTSRPEEALAYHLLWRSIARS